MAKGQLNPSYKKKSQLHLHSQSDFNPCDDMWRFKLTPADRRARLTLATQLLRHNDEYWQKKVYCQSQVFRQIDIDF